jgi:hypothetical protein
MIKLLDILEEINIKQKELIGTGTESNVYYFEKQPNRVIKYHTRSTFGLGDRSWKDNISIMKDNPDIFTKVYKDNPEKHFIILEKVNTKEIIEIIKQMTKIFIDENNKDKELYFGKYWDYDPPTFMSIYDMHGVIDVINIIRTGILENNTSDIQLILNIFKSYPNLLNIFKKWVKFIELVNSKIGLKIDLHFGNIGYDKQGNIKMFDF